MADTKTEKTVVEEIKLAAKRLRCDHRYPCQPPHGTVWAPGRCLLCGQECPDDDEEIPEALREPLAALLDHMADIAASAAERGLRNAAQGQVAHTLAVARVLNGTTP
jgi:hypothetical protein